MGYCPSPHPPLNTSPSALLAPGTSTGWASPPLPLFLYLGNYSATKEMSLFKASQLPSGRAQYS
jgi:hypothetical protein